MPMENPPHPGEIIRDLYLEPLALTVTQAAAGLGVTRKTFSLLLNGPMYISDSKCPGEEFYRILVSGIVVLARENGDERRKATKRCPGFMI